MAQGVGPEFKPKSYKKKKIKITARCHWLTSVILATWETEIRRIIV
jgi:hypothetical protein